MQEINRLVYSSKIINVRAMDKLILSFVVLALTLYLSSIATSIITIFIMSILNINLSRVGLKKYIMLCLIPFGFLVVSMISIILEFNSSNYLVSFSLLSIKCGVTYEGLIRGANVGLRALAALVCVYFLVLNTSIEDIIGVLRKCRIPMLVINLIEMIYRFIFILIDEANSGRYSIISRGSGIGLKGKINLVGLTLSRVMISSISKAERIEYSIKSRGYKGEIRYLDRNIKGSNKILLLTLGIGCVQICFSLI